jgi:hypothetical protein
MAGPSTRQLGINTPWDDLIWAQAWYDPEKYALIKSTINNEGSWKTDAHNPSDPSAGLMQILYGVPQSPYPGYTREQLYDPETNIILGSRLLLGLYSRLFSDPVATASAYNQGETGYRTRGVLAEQWPYVNSVVDDMQWYLDNDPYLLAQTDVPADSGGGWSGAITTETDVGVLEDEPAFQVASSVGLALALGLGVLLIARR